MSRIDYSKWDKLNVASDSEEDEHAEAGEDQQDGVPSPAAAPRPAPAPAAPAASTTASSTASRPDRVTAPDPVPDAASSSASASTSSPGSGSVACTYAPSTGDRSCTFFKAWAVPPDHPVFTHGTASYVGELVRFPILFHRLDPRPPLSIPRSPALDNTRVTYMMIDAITGFAPPQWQQGVGSVVCARRDRRPLPPAHVEAFWMLCHRLLGIFSSDGRVNVAEEMSKESFASFYAEYRARMLGTKDRRAEWRQVTQSPYEAMDDVHIANSTNFTLQRAPSHLASLTGMEDTLIFQQLLPETERKVLSLLHPNEIQCTLRLVCKAAASRFSAPHHTTIRLSQPVPPHAFAHRWGQPGAMRRLTLPKRRQLLCLTAASGSLPNLQLLLPLMGCTLSAEVLASAAAAGQLEACQWLHQTGCPWDHKVLVAAGRSGCMEVCEWLLASGCPGCVDSALEGAARAGNVPLLHRLQQSLGPPKCPVLLMDALAEGCDLPSLQRLHAAWLGPEPIEWDEHSDTAARLLAAAARSPTPDWRAKLEWLETRTGLRHFRARMAPFACADAAACADALDRLAWLRDHGRPALNNPASYGAACRGNAATLLSLQPSLNAASQATAFTHLAENGHLEAARELHAAGWASRADEAAAHAARGGHIHVVAWALEALGADLTAGLFRAAAAAGSVALLAWLRGRGCEWDEEAWVGGAESGCEEALEWLAERGCPMDGEGRPYAAAAAAGDLATLSCLRRAGCPWAADGSTLCAAVARGSPLECLRWLAEAGCPADWEEAARALRLRSGRPDARVAVWLRRQAEEGRAGEQDELSATQLMPPIIYYQAS